MGLGIYRSADPGAKASQDTFASPIVVAADGRRGTAAQRRLYVRNDNPNFMYSGISVRPIDTAGPNLVDGSIGYYVKVSAGDTQPTESGWNLLAPGSGAQFSGVLGSGGDLATYLPFWVKVQTPKNVAIQNITDVKLRLQATKIAN